jgi:ABC-type antimicrobial peptide transport system permease subunit
MAYYPILQVPRLVRNATALEVRTNGAPEALPGGLRKAVAEVAPALLIDNIMTTAEQVDQNLRRERIVAQVTGGLGLLALALASFGLFGVMSYSVSRRTGELGVRFAIGATRAQVLRMILRESLLLAGGGLIVGIPAALATSRLLSGLLFGVAPNDPTTILSATAVLAVVATLAGLVPAWHASRVDPLVALRQE